MADASIVVDSLSKSFANETVLRDINFTVADGDLCVVVGPSGCGKSTLLQCLAGLVEYDRGHIELDGRSDDTLTVAERDLGYVFQEFEDALFPHMTVAENIAFGLRQQDVDYDEDEIDAKIDEMLDLLSIPETKDNVPDELSGGQQQRVELARQLVRDCDIMLLDDPLADLDYKLQKRMELEIRSIHADLESTFLYVTHNQDQALKLADKLVVMNNGMVEQVGTPAEVYQSPETAFVGRFVGDSNAFEGTVTATEGDTVSLDTPLGDVRASVASGTVSTGDASLFQFRPNAVRRVDEGSADNSFAAQLIDQTYTSEETELTFRHHGSEAVVQAVTPRRSSLEVGDDVTIGWDASDTVFFPTLSVTDTTTVTDLQEI